MTANNAVCSLAVLYYTTKGDSMLLEKHIASANTYSRSEITLNKGEAIRMIPLA